MTFAGSADALRGPSFLGAVDTLRHAHAEFRGHEGAPPRTGDLLEDARDLVGHELIEVEARLANALRDGASPGPEAATHLLVAGGKRVRPMLALLAADALGGVTDATREVAMVSELIHLATLLHDDVVDEATERRGRPTSGRVFGNAVSVLSGDLLLTTALSRTEALADPKLLTSLVRTLRALVDGELIQLRGRGNGPSGALFSRENYEAIAVGKTASLFVWAAQAGASTAPKCDSASVDALGSFGHHLGLAFQIVDDVIDYLQNDTGKLPFADLREGKATLPVIVAAERDPSLLPEILAACQMVSDADVARVAARIVATGACEEVRLRAHEETRRAMDALAYLPPSRSVTLLTAVAASLAARVS